MKLEEYREETKDLALYFPVLREIPRASFDKWFETLEDWPTPLFKIAIRLVCQNMSQWHRGMNLRGVIAQYEAEARSIYADMMERKRVKDPSRMLEERCNPIDGRREVQKLLASLNQKMEVGQ